MGLRRRFVFAVLAVGGVFGSAACASVIGLDAFEIVSGGPDAASDAGGVSGSDGSITTADGITVSPVDIVFPQGNCSDSKTATFTIANHGAVQTSYSAMVSSPVFAIQNGVGYVAPGASVTITVTATGPTSGPATADVTITTGTTTVPVHLTYETTGGTLTATPATLDFGTIHDGVQSAPLDVTFANNGSSDVTVTAVTGLTTDFGAPPTPFTVKAGQTATEPFTMSANSNAAASAMVGFTTDAPLCGASPRIALTGLRTSNDITIDPVTINLGDIPCTAQAGNGSSGADAGVLPTGTITISNYGGTATMFTAENAGQFQVNPGSGTVAAATPGNSPAITTMTVSLAGPVTTPESFASMLTINADDANDTRATVAVQATVVGALFTGVENIISTHIGQPEVLPLQNRGNVPACLTYTLSAPAGYFLLSLSTETIAANGSSTATVTYVGPEAGEHGGTAGTLTVGVVTCNGASAPAPICQQPIPVFELQPR